VGRSPAETVFKVAKFGAKATPVGRAVNYGFKAAEFANVVQKDGFSAKAVLNFANPFHGGF